MKKRIKFISAAVLAGVLVYMLPKLGVLYIFLALVWLAVYLVAAREKGAERRFLIAFIVLIVTSRLVMSLLVMHARGEALTQDEGLYGKRALTKIYENYPMEDMPTRFWHYFNDYDLSQPTYGYNSYSYMLSVFFRMFGYQIQAARLINILLCVAAFMMIYYIGRDTFGSKSAMAASALFAFFPSIFLWSSMISTDMLIISSAAVCIMSMIRLARKFSPVWAAAFAAAVFVIWNVKQFLAAILIATVTLSFAAMVFGRLSKRWRFAVAASAAIAAVFIFMSPVAKKAESEFLSKMGYVVTRQEAFALADDSGYLIYPEHCYRTETCAPSDIPAAYLKGIMYSVFAPFPWRVDSTLQLMAYPQMVLWYFMIPLTLYGFYEGFKRNRFATAVVALYVFALFSLFAVTEGNMGALFRHRDMAMPFLLVYFTGGCEAMALKLKQKDVPG